MASIYCIILEGEFDKIFKSERGWKKELSGMAQEIVYTKTLKTKPWLMVKVYSSIHKSDGIGRKCGADSIKICAINTNTNRGILKTNRIHRTKNWEKRVTDRVIEVWSTLLEMYRN